MALLQRMPLWAPPSRGLQRLPDHVNLGPDFASKGENHQLWQHREKEHAFQFQVSEMQLDKFVDRSESFLSQKNWLGRTLQERFVRLFSRFDSSNARTLGIE